MIIKVVLEDKLKMKTTSKMKITLEMKMTSKMKETEKEDDLRYFKNEEDLKFKGT